MVLIEGTVVSLGCIFRLYPFNPLRINGNYSRLIEVTSTRTIFLVNRRLPINHIDSAVNALIGV